MYYIIYSIITNINNHVLHNLLIIINNHVLHNLLIILIIMYYIIY